jgi:predicted Zn finger-like uncharacterized protein
MIVTCASCLTKFYLDDSRIPAKGAKVRCSRCKQVFYVVTPPETKEEIIEDFESFAKYHEELIEPGQKDLEFPPSLEEEEKETPTEEEEEEEKEGKEKEEESFLFFDKAPAGKEDQVPSKQSAGEEKAEVDIFKPKRMLRRERRGPSLFFSLLVVLVLLIFGVFYLWAELGSGGKLFPYIQYPVKKITELWSDIWGSEKQGLIVGGLNGYEEKMEEIPLYIIEGKVTNQSRSTKRYVKVKVMIFDQNRDKMAEKETICGRILPREELINLPVAFFRGKMLILPKKEEDSRTPAGETIPFMVIFKDLPSQAKEFQVEILEAPNL